jgi:hypothetical protein
MPWRSLLNAAPLVRRRTIWCPTWVGWSLIAILVLVPGLVWLLAGESFLSETERLPAEVLVVEGWIGREGVRAAAAEFKQGGYTYIATSGGPVRDPWKDNPSSYAEMAASELVQAGIPQDRILVASSKATERGRTFESAVAVRRLLQASSFRPKALNVFTLGAHARRSRLVFAKVEGQDSHVGTIAWTPPDYASQPWWHSSERAKAIISETVGYGFELLANSGRMSNAGKD